MRSRLVDFWGAIIVATVFLGGCAAQKPLLSNMEAQEQVTQLKAKGETDSLAMARIDTLGQQIQISLKELEGKIKQLSDRETSLETRLTILSDRVENLEQKVSGAPKAEKPVPVTPIRPPEVGVTGVSYQEALQDYYAGKYRQAIEEFSQFIQLHPESDLSDNAQYWIGECYYSLNEYPQALAEFRKVFDYPKTNKADAAQLKIGYCWVELGEKARALAEFKKLLSQYPSSEYVERAKQMISRLRGY